MSYVDELNAKTFAPATAAPERSPQASVNGSQTDPGLGSRRWGLLNSFVIRHMRRVSPATVCVWLALYRHAEPDGLVRMVSIDRIKEIAGLSRRTVHRALDELMNQKLMARVARGNKQSGPTIYRLLLVSRVPKTSPMTISQGATSGTLQGATSGTHTELCAAAPLGTARPLAEIGAA